MTDEFGFPDNTALNGDQAAYVRWLRAQPPESLCECGWYKKGACYSCNKIKRESEAQVRELRELLQKIAISTQAGLHIASALRSAPPSEWEKSSQALRDSTQHVHDENETNAGAPVYGPGEYSCATCGLGLVECEHWKGMLTQAPYDKTDVWEERKDLAQQVPAAPDGFTATRKVREDASVPSTADKSVEYSTPQDSPSRSEWVTVRQWLHQNTPEYEHACVLLRGISVEWRVALEEFGAMLLGEVERIAHQHHCAYGCGKKIAEEVTRQLLNPSAPPSPAREKEKAE